MSENLYFVPFCDKVIRRYKSHEQVPSHLALDDRLYNGKIQVTLTAKSPLMVGGEGRMENGGFSTATFSKDAQGKFRIPGSTLRGLIRQNMQILGLGSICTGKGEDIPGVDYKGNNKVHGGRDPKFGLPRSHEKNMMDYPRSIMGFVIQVPDEKKKDQNGRPKLNTHCYRSRISVGDLNAVGRPMELNAKQILQRLPRQDHPDFITELPNGRFRLKGIRQYPPRPQAPEPRYSTQRFQPLDTGTRFTGVIRYRNLHADELGLLLWCLRLEEGCLHTIGMGKAQGYGQVALRIERLVEYDTNVLYGSLTGVGTPVQNTAARVDQLIRCYRDYAAHPGRAGMDPAQMDHIKTFFALRSE